MKSLLPILLLFVGSPLYAASVRCEALFASRPAEFTKQKLSARDAKKMYASAAAQRNSTLGARGEKKRTVPSTAIKHLIQEFEKDMMFSDLNLKLVLRDKKVEGRRNMTMTMYYNLFSTAEGQTMKIRARKYGSIDSLKEVVNENIDLADITHNHTFVEYKMDIPGETDAVYKPRVLVSDMYVKMIGTADFLKNFDKIFAETSALNLEKKTSDAATVRDMFAALKALHVGQYDLKPLLYTIYERFSYSVQFKPKRSALPELFDVQLTVDENITSKNLVTDEIKKIYPTGISVFEWKIPIEVSKLQTSVVEGLVPGYAILTNFLGQVNDIHLRQYQKDKGKMYHAQQDFED